MTMQVVSVGSGPDICFLHGWGMNSEVWRETATYLSDNYRVTLIDLPGFGINADVPCDFSLQNITELVAPLVPDQAVLVGWSLGGLIANSIVLSEPGKIKKLVLIASNAQFAENKNWPTAMKIDVLEGFVENLSQDYKQTLQRFLMLQARGGDNAKDTIRELKQRLYQHGEPSEQALYRGLQLLKNISFITQLADINIPTLLLYGKLDALVPVSAATEMLNRLPEAKLYIFPKAAHAPFISHFNEFTKELDTFLHE